MTEISIDRPSKAIQPGMAVVATDGFAGRSSELVKENRAGQQAGRGVQVRVHVGTQVPAQMLAVLALALVIWLVAAVPARAGWAIVGDTVPSGQVIDDDVLIRGTDVVIDGTITGDLLAVGSTVTVNGPVAGSVVSLARTVTVNGEVGGSVYTLARTLTLGSTADVRHSAHFAGLLLDSQKGSRIGRDLVAASVRGSISSHIGRAMNAMILLLTFNGQIGGGVDVPAPGTAPSVPVAPGAALFFVSSGGEKPPALAMAAISGLGQSGAAAADATTAAGIPGWLVARLADLVVLLLVGALVLWLRPVLIRRPADRLIRQPLPAAGLGLVALTIALNGAAVAILLAVLLLVLGIWLGVLTLWELTLLLWGIGYPGLILVASSFALIVLYGSKAIVAVLVGELILKRVAPSSLEYRILPLLLGLVLYVALRSIPIMGRAIEVTVTIFGLGAAWLALRRQPLPAAQAHAPLFEGGVQPANVGID